MRGALPPKDKGADMYSDALHARCHTLTAGGAIIVSTERSTIGSIRIASDLFHRTVSR